MSNATIPQLDAPAALKASFLEVQQQRRTLARAYEAVAHRSSSPPAVVSARAVYLAARHRREESATNYAARRRQRGTWTTTLERARSEFFTAYWDEIMRLHDWCEARDVAAGADPRVTELRTQFFTAYWSELSRMNAWCTSQDDGRVPPTIGANLGWRPASRRQ